ncbi:MAG TPA: choice-of-anchor L domain-containing protein, partial [Taishania sp.]|nr:choice-of-anchor L domain-containing protein [Taishania sp.]
MSFTLTILVADVVLKLPFMNFFYNSLFFLTVCLSMFGIHAQIQVTNTMTPAQLVQDVLVGSGVTATNITVNGSAALANSMQWSASYFNQNGTSFPMPEGVLLTTGRGSVAVGPNSVGSHGNSAGTLDVVDPDVSSIAAGSVKNGIVIEFDFMATGNALNFDYIFGSEEYPEFAPPNNTSYNDVFGFFLSGPGISGPYSNGAVNIAIVPGTTNTPVSINNVNPITNSVYYVSNVGGLTYGTAVQYDGLTTRLTAFSELICGETYHIKLAICNVGDKLYDSGVFLEAGSFTTNPLEFGFNTFTTDNTMYEGCNHISQLIFTRAGCGNENDTLVAWVDFGGTATNGVDYSLLPDSVILLPGVDTVIWDIIPFEDYITEGIESIDIHVRTYIAITGDTIHGYGQFFINDRPLLEVTGIDREYYCLDHETSLTATVSGGMAPIEFFWDTGDSTNTIVVPTTENGTRYFVVSVVDACGYTDTDTVALTMNQTLAIDTLLSLPATCQPVGKITTETYPFGAHLQNPGDPTSYNLTFDWVYENDTNMVFPNQSSLENLSSGWYHLTLTDNVVGCTVFDSVFVDVTDVPSAVLNVNPSSGCAP